MQTTLEKLSKTDLIALIGQKDLLLKERDFTIQQKESQIAEKETVLAEKKAEIIARKSEIEKLRRMLFGLGGPARRGSVSKHLLYNFLWTSESIFPNRKSRRWKRSLAKRLKKSKKKKRRCLAALIRVAVYFPGTCR